MGVGVCTKSNTNSKSFDFVENLPVYLVPFSVVKGEITGDQDFWLGAIACRCHLVRDWWPGYDGCLAWLWRLSKV